jgi:hypothetical protein
LPSSSVATLRAWKPSSGKGNRACRSASVTRGGALHGGTCASISARQRTSSASSAGEPGCSIGVGVGVGGLFFLWGGWG